MKRQSVPTNPVQVIREKCLDCSGRQEKEVTLCTVKSCPLHPWRLGKNPYAKKSESRAESMRKRWAEKKKSESAA